MRAYFVIKLFIVIKMGNIQAPQTLFTKNQQVEIKSSALSHEHVPKEIKRYGPSAVVVHTTKLMQSRASPTVYITRIYYPQTKHYETVLTSDLRLV